MSWSWKNWLRVCHMKFWTSSLNWMADMPSKLRPGGACTNLHLFECLKFRALWVLYRFPSRIHPFSALAHCFSALVPIFLEKCHYIIKLSLFSYPVAIYDAWLKLLASTFFVFLFVRKPCSLLLRICQTQYTSLPAGGDILWNQLTAYFCEVFPCACLY